MSARPCPNERFAVEVPLWAPSFFSAFKDKLATRVSDGLDRTWFCPPGQTCLGTVAARTDSILSDYSDPIAHPNVPPLRREGHRRLLQLEFVRVPKKGLPPVRISVLPQYACAAVARIRAKAAALLGIPVPAYCTNDCPQAPFLVSRECLTRPLDVEAWLPGSSMSWPLDRIGALPDPSLPSVHVALIDTGIPSANRALLNVVSEIGLPGFYGPNSSSYHPHGGQVAALIRSVAPNAVIRSYRALDQHGAATVGTLARAMDRAIYDAPLQEPLIMNLSLGFAPHASRPSHLDGTGCITHEDGLGESLRYVLEVAAQRNPQGPPLLAVAAGGNQIFASLSAPEIWPLGRAITPCGSPASAETLPSMFFPASLNSAPVCRNGIANAIPLLATGASDLWDRAASTTIVEDEPLLAAPGQHVMVSSPLPPLSADAECGSGDIGLQHGFESGISLSGSSVSAAFTSGALAWLLAVMPNRNGIPWSPAALARFVYLTGEPVCRASTAGVRRLSVARMNAAVDGASTWCDALFDCVDSGAHPLHPIVGATTRAICQFELEACLGPDVEVPTSCADFAEDEPWPNGYPAGGSPCFDEWGRPPGPSSSGPSPELEKYEDAQLMGLGPQPTVGSCPSCQLEIWQSNHAFSLWAELSDEYPSGTSIGDPYVVILDRFKQPQQWIPLDGGPVNWTPGRVIRLWFEAPFVPVDAIGVLMDGGMAVLDLKVVISGRASRVASPLRLSLMP